MAEILSYSLALLLEVDGAHGPLVPARLQHTHRLHPSSANQDEFMVQIIVQTTLGITGIEHS